MNDLKTRKFWFLVLSISICISFVSFTLYGQYVGSSTIYSENFSELGTESDEKSSEPNHSFYLQEQPFELSTAIQGRPVKNLMKTKFKLSTFWPSPNTPPPDLASPKSHPIF